MPDPHSPAGHHSHIQHYGNKKDVGVCLLRAYPIAQALALPLLKDKQRKACPRQPNIHIHHGLHHSHLTIGPLDHLRFQPIMTTRKASPQLYTQSEYTTVNVAYTLLYI